MEFSNSILVGSQTDTVYECRSACGGYKYHKVDSKKGVHFKVSRLTVCGEWVFLKNTKTRNKAEMACIVNQWKKEARSENV